MDPHKLAERFRHHPPTDAAVISAHELVRSMADQFAAILNQLLPESAEKDKALDAVDLAAMYANACIARTQLGGPPYPVIS